MERAHAGDARVVEKHVDTALGPRGLVGESPRVVGIGHVGEQRVRLPTVGVDQLHGLLRAGAVDVGHHHARALAREQQRAGAADP